MKNVYWIIIPIMLTFGISDIVAGNGNGYKTEFYNFENINSGKISESVAQDSVSSSQNTKSAAIVTAACVNTNVVFTINTLPGNGLGCPNVANFFWDFGDGTTKVATNLTSPQSWSHTYTQPGSYTVTLTTTNSCGTISNSQIICIEQLPTPSFKLDAVQGCAPLTVHTTNTTSLVNICSILNYRWEITYAPGLCGGTSSYTYINSTDSTSLNPVLKFINPGTYTIRLSATNLCGTESTTQTVIINEPPKVTINPIADLCGTSSISPTAAITNCSQSGSPLTYNWSFPGGTPSSSTLANPTGITYAATGTHTISLTVSNECGVSNTATTTFNIKQSPHVTNASLSQSVCSGTATYQVNLTADIPGTTFSWTATASSPLISGYLPSGTTDFIPSQTLITTDGVPGTVTYTITPNFNGCDGPTVNYIVTVNPAPIISKQPLSETVCLNSIPADLTVNYSGIAITPNYQWYSITSVNPAVPVGTNSSNYTPPTTTVGTISYYCVLSFPSGTCGNLTTDTITVTVNPLPTITLQPTNSQDICVGGTIAAPLIVAATGGVGTPTYQWYSNSSNSNIGGTLISGETNPTFLPSAFGLVGQYYYYVVVTMSGCGVVTSNVAIINVVPDPTISSQPFPTQTLCQGTTPVTLSVNASGGLGVFSYQWYQNVNNNTSTGTAIPGATNKNYIPVTTVAGTLYYYCVVSQAGLNCQATSNLATVIINPAPMIVNQPVSSSVCILGAIVPLSVTYTNGVGLPTYQWYKNTTNDTIGGTAIPLANATSYNPQNTVSGTTYYYCLLTFPSGGCSVIATKIATVSVNPLPAIIMNQNPTQEICVGTTIPTPLTAKYTGGAGTPSYKWYKSPINGYSGVAIVGANDSIYTPPAFVAPGSYYYYAEVSLSGNNCGNTVSDISEIIVDANPTVGTQPLASQSVCLNAVPQTLSVIPGGPGTYTYQWYSNTSNNSTSGTLIPTGTNSTYVPPTISVGTMYYYCIIKYTTGATCPVTSDVSTVIVNPQPTINLQPQNLITCVGNSPSLTVGYKDGTGIPTYQWFNSITGTPIAASNSATFNPSTATAGTTSYYCMISMAPGGCSVLISDTVQVVVNPIPVITSFTSSICNRSSFSITPQDVVDGTVPVGTTYTWSMPIVSPAGSVTGASAQPTPQTSISQTLTNTTTNFATVTYKVTPLSGSCPGSDFIIVVTVNPTILPGATVKNISCFGGADGSITTTITGGVPFNGGKYTTIWSGPNGYMSNSSSISGLLSGVYSLTITDSIGCQEVDSFSVIEPADIKITNNLVKNPSYSGATNGQIGITITGGTQPYNYSWTKNGSYYANTQDLDSIGAGNYVVTVSDTNSCGPKIASYSIIDPSALIITLVNQTNLNCYGDANGTISVSVIGGVPVQLSPGVFGYWYSWSGPNGFSSTTKDLTGLAAGTYILTVTDNSGYTKQLTVIISQPNKLNIGVNTVPNFNCVTKTVSEINTAQVSGGTAPYQYNWSYGSISGANGEIMETTQAGNVVLQVTDAKGCTGSYTLPLTISTTGIDYKLLDCDTHLYQFDAIVLDPSLTYTYFWDFGDGATDINKSVNHAFTTAGNHTVRLTLTSPTCSTVFSQTLNVEAPPVLTLDKDPKICFGDSTIVHVSGANSYKWNDNSVGDSILINRTGQFSVTGTTLTGCTSVLTFNATNFDPYNYTIQSNKNEVSTENPNISLWSESIPYSEYFWDFGDGKTDKGNNLDHIYNITNEKSFDIKLKIINPNGCVEYATKTILVINSSMYNTFSPNGDGIDDVFMLGWHIKVYNRNGISLFDGTTGWDGTYKGKPVSNDTYFYVLYYSSGTATKTSSGYVTVVR